MGSIAQLKAESRALNLDTTREPRLNRQRQSHKRQRFQIYTDESARQLHQEYQEAEGRGMIKMSVDFGASSSASTTSDSPPPPHNPIEALQNSLASGKFSDLNITHGTRRWKAHRVVVCSQSSVLESKIENVRGIYNLSLNEYDYDAVCLMLEYLYGSNYSNPDREPDFGLPTHIKVHNLAVQLSISGLISLSIAKFRHNLNNYITDPLIFFTCVRTIYRTTTIQNPGLRLAVLEAAVSEMRKMLSDPHREAFLNLTAEVTDFQTEMYLLMLDYPTRPMEVVSQELCGECGPREEGDGYEVTTQCKGCEKEKTLSFY